MLLLALFMSLGFAANAQYVPAVKAEAIVTSVVKDLKENKNITGQTANVTASSNSTLMIHNLKIKVGEAMMKPLHQGRTVEDALTAALAQIPTGNISTRNQAVTEVDAFYRNLLKN